MKIHELIKGRDGNVRGAELKMPSKDTQPILLRRPLKCLYPLEECHQASGKAADENSTVQSDENSTVQSDENNTVQSDDIPSCQVIQSSQRILTQTVIGMN